MGGGYLFFYWVDKSQENLAFLGLLTRLFFGTVSWFLIGAAADFLDVTVGIADSSEESTALLRQLVRRSNGTSSDLDRDRTSGETRSASPPPPSAKKVEPPSYSFAVGDRVRARNHEGVITLIQGIDAQIKTDNGATIFRQLKVLTPVDE